MAPAAPQNSSELPTQDIVQLPATPGMGLAPSGSEFPPVKQLVLNDFSQRIVLTVAFSAILGTSNREPFAFTESNTVLIGHLVVGLASTCQGTIVIVVSATSHVSPSFRGKISIIFLS